MRNGALLLVLSTALMTTTFETEKSWSLRAIQMLLLMAIALQWPHPIRSPQSAIVIKCVSIGIILTGAVTAFILFR